MRRNVKQVCVTILACCALGSSSGIFATQTECSAESVVQWNAAILGLAEAEDGFLTLKGLRTAAMMHIAMHDALSAINGHYAPYVFVGDAGDANPVAAVSQAAFTVAAVQYPDQLEPLGLLNEQWLAAVAGEPGTTRGIALGESSANAILRSRHGDGWDTSAEYTWHPMGPGVYAEFNEHSGTPDGFVFGAGWAKAQGFALAEPGQFRSPAPPEIISDEYTLAFNEVKDLGRFQSINRNPDQTHQALWWKDFAENSHNRLARDLVIKENLCLEESARLFALVNMSIFDAYVSVFDNKFFYNHWRPYTAIRWAEHDGNPDTIAEETWTNTHQHTYAFPSYPSAHGAACAAAMTAFAYVFGDDYAFRMRIPMVDIAGPFSGKIEMHPGTREFASFSDAAKECALSRLFLGIHFRYDSLAGIELGQLVGQNVIDTVLLEISEPPYNETREGSPKCQGMQPCQWGRSDEPMQPARHGIPESCVSWFCNACPGGNP